MDRTRFVISDARDPETLNDVTCAICNKVAERPTNCRDDHVFCYACIQERLDEFPACPVDNAALTSDDLVLNRFMERTVSRLTIRCGNRDAGGANAMVGAIRKRLRHPLGCRWEGTVRQLKEHSNTCQFNFIPCRNCARMDIPVIGMNAHLRECSDRYTKCDMCDAKVLLRALPDHMESCPAASVYCPNHCLLRPGETTDVRMVRREKVKEHLTKCPRQVIDCEYHELGCQFRGRRENMPLHMETAIQEHMAILRCGLAEIRRYVGLKPRFALSDGANATPASPAVIELNGAVKLSEDILDTQVPSAERNS